MMTKRRSLRDAFGQAPVAGHAPESRRLRDLIPQMEAMGYAQRPVAGAQPHLPAPESQSLRDLMPRMAAMGYPQRPVGAVTGPGGPTSDTIAARLSPGEYVLPADTVDAVGVGRLDALRQATATPGRGRTTLRDGVLHMAGGGEAMSPEKLRLHNERLAYQSVGQGGKIENPNFRTATSPERAAFEREMSGRSPGPNVQQPGAEQARVRAGQAVGQARTAHAQATPQPKAGVLRRGLGAVGGATKATVDLGSKAVKRGLPAAGAAYGAFQTGTAVGEGRYGDAAVSGLDTAASIGLMTPAAPAAGVYLGSRAIAEGANHLVDKYGLGDAIGGTINQIGLKSGLWGVDDSAYLEQKALEGQQGQAPAQGRGWGQPQAPTAQPPSGFSQQDYGNDTARLQAAIDQENAVPGFARGVSLRSDQAFRGEYGAPTDNLIVRDGNSYSGGRVGPSAAIGDLQPDRSVNLRDFGGGFMNQGGNMGAQAQRDLAHARGMANLRDGLPYEGAPAGSGVAPYRPGPSASDLMQQMADPHSNLGRARRNSAMQTQSALESAARWSGGTSRDRRRAAAAVPEQLAASMRDQDARILDSGQAPDHINRYTADVQAQTSRENNAATLRQAELTARNSADRRGGGELSLKDLWSMQKDLQAQDAQQEERDAKNYDRTRDQFAIFGEDNKMDQQATSNMQRILDKIAPGFSTMSPRDRAKAVPHAEALTTIFQRSMDNRELGFWKNLFGNNNPSLDTMPDFKGGKLKRAGVGGALPGGAGINGYYVDMGDGRELPLGKDLPQNVIDLIEYNTRTGRWK